MNHAHRRFFTRPWRIGWSPRACGTGLGRHEVFVRNHGDPGVHKISDRDHLDRACMHDREMFCFRVLKIIAGSRLKIGIDRYISCKREP
jgi:hypothetical protein